VSNAGVFDERGHTVSVLLGNGDGTFQAKTDFEVDLGPFDLVAADFNEDGNMDLATANIENGTTSVLLGNGDGTFQPEVTYPGGTHGITAIRFSPCDNIGLAVSGPRLRDIYPCREWRRHFYRGCKQRARWAQARRRRVQW